MPADIAPHTRIFILNLPSEANLLNLRVRRASRPRASTQAKAGHTTGATGSDQSVNQGDQNSGSRSANGVSQGDATSRNVELLVRDAQSPLIHQHLGREGFVDFKQIDVICREAVPVEQVGHPAAGAVKIASGEPQRCRGPRFWPMA